MRAEVDLPAEPAVEDLAGELRLATSLAADLAAWCRLLGLYDCDGLMDAEPGKLRFWLLSLPVRVVRPPAPAC